MERKGALLSVVGCTGKPLHKKMENMGTTGCPGQSRGDQGHDTGAPQETRPAAKCVAPAIITMMSQSIRLRPFLSVSAFGSSQIGLISFALLKFRLITSSFRMTIRKAAKEDDFHLGKAAYGPYMEYGCNPQLPTLRQLRAPSARVAMRVARTSPRHASKSLIYLEHVDHGVGQRT